MCTSCKSPLLVVFCLLGCSLLEPVGAELCLRHQHPDPEAVVQELRGRVNESIARRHLLGLRGADSCGTGNPIDDCWRCNPNWTDDALILANCAVGFGLDALGGKGGKLYYVTDSSDSDPVNPAPGTLRFGAIQSEPLWILFSSDMVINLNYELLVNSFKTIDGRGAKVEITGKGCVILDSVTNVIIHNIHIHHCEPSGNAEVRRSTTWISPRGPSDGDGISVNASSKIWIDHCSLSSCADGLIDVTMGSTAVTISNSFFSNHDKAMLLGHSDGFTADAGMQVTVAFNRFGWNLSERMPRCRFGYFHVVNNDYSSWRLYAVGGSAAPTINSQGNRYIAPENSGYKEVTKRIDTEEREWMRWSWRSEGDLLVNGAFFITSGAELSPRFGESTSVAPLAANIIEQLTMNAGVMDLPSFNANSGSGTPSSPGVPSQGGTPPNTGLIIEGSPAVPWVDGDVYDPPRQSNAPESAASSSSIALFILLVLSISAL